MLASLSNSVASLVFEASSNKLLTWFGAKRSGEARWANHDVHLNVPKREFLGPGLDKISFSVRLDISRGVVPRDELRNLRYMRDTGQVLQFVIGGELAGDYTVNSLSEDLIHFDAAGVLILAVVELSLEEYQ